MGLVLIRDALAHGGLQATAMDMASSSLLPDAGPWLGLLGALGVAQLGRRWLPLYLLGQLLSPGLALGGLVLLYLGRQGLVGEVRWPAAVALLAGLALPAESIALEALALLPLALLKRPLAWVCGIAGGWALCSSF
mgnify:CR=1 FL=1